MRIIATLVAAAGIAAAIDGAGLVQEHGKGAPATTAPELALRLADYASAPITGLPEGLTNNAGSLARMNFLREEPAPKARFFVNDLTGPLSSLDPA